MRDIWHFYMASHSQQSSFISWINFMFLRFGTINIWPNPEEVAKTVPKDFKSRYLTTRVILVCTEVKCQMPSSLLLNSRLFSSYKTPSGVITFISHRFRVVFILLQDSFRSK